MTEPLRRIFDVCAAAMALVLASPLLLIAAVAIKLTSRGPVLYRQERVGKDGSLFEMLKLRTMVQGAEHVGARLAVDRGDARITRVGRVLRRTSVDELPNLVNVLRGDMSIIGPRPTVKVQVDQYTERQRRRLELRPGITGWAQVNGRASLSWPARIEMDIDYIDRCTIGMDLQILALTVRQLLGSGRDNYKGDSGGWVDP